VARNLTGTFDTAVQVDFKPFLLVKLDTGGGYVRVWNGIGDLTYDSEVYLGAGTLGKISTFEEDTDLSANGINIEMSGIPSSMISTALGQMEQGRSVQIWIGLFDSSDAIIADPYELFAGFVDAVEVHEGPETSSISINAENRLIRLEKANTRRYTPEDQGIDDPTDLGFEFVASLQDKEIIFGKS
jgi:hypothetical protein